MKTRAGPDGVHIFNRATGLNILLDEISVAESSWSLAPNVPAPSLCESFRLSNRKGEWDFYDPSGRNATLCRQFKDETIRADLLYMRADLMAEYLGDEFDLLWFVWGERNLHYKEMINIGAEVQDVLRGHQQIHKFSRKWVR